MCVKIVFIVIVIFCIIECYLWKKIVFFFDLNIGNKINIGEMSFYLCFVSIMYSLFFLWNMFLSFKSFNVVFFENNFV